MDKDFNDIDRGVDYSRNTVTVKLASIQQRCSQLLAEPDALGLTLEEPLPVPDSTNPYDRGP